MTRRYFTQAALALMVLNLAGCGDDNEPMIKAKMDPLKGDEDDVLFDPPDAQRRPGDYEADIELLPGESWIDAQTGEGGNVFASYSQRGTYRTYGTRNGGRQAWRVPRVGSAGRRALVVFPSGRRYVVVLGKANRTERGFVFKRGSHGGYYIHAVYGDRSQSVTIYW